QISESLYFIPNRPQLPTNFILKFMRAFKHIGKLRCQSCHFLFERLAVIYLLFNTNIATRCKNIILHCDILYRSYRADAFFILKCAILEGFECIREFLDIFLRKITMLTVYLMSHLAGINKYCLAFLF